MPLQKTFVPSTYHASKIKVFYHNYLCPILPLLYRSFNFFVSKLVSNSKKRPFSGLLCQNISYSIINLSQQPPVQLVVCYKPSKGLCYCSPQRAMSQAFYWSAIKRYFLNLLFSILLLVLLYTSVLPRL